MQVKRRQGDTTARLRHLVKLASVSNVAELAPARQHELWRSVVAAAGQRPLRAQNASKDEKAPLDDKWVGPIVYAVHATARTLLNALADGTSAWVFGNDMRVDYQCTSTGELRFDLRGEATATWPYAVATFLANPEVGGRVRRCPHCQSLFVRVRRQIYCSSTCTDRATWKKYPERKKRAARLKQYEKHGWTFGRRKGAKKR